MRIRVVFILALMTFVLPASARAGTIRIDTFFQGYGAHVAVAGEDASFEIGSVVMSNGTGLGDPLDGTTFEAYCVDFDTSVFGPTLPDPPGTYDATRGDMSAWVDGSGLPSSGSGQRAAWLYNEFATTFDPDATSDLGKRQRSALQMAIWNGLYDSDFTVADNGLASNTVYFIEDNHALTALADTYLAALLAAGPLVGSSDAAWLKLSANGVDAQDFIGPTSVPEPASVLLLGAGMATLAAFRSRKSLPGRG